MNISDRQLIETFTTIGTRILEVTNLAGQRRWFIATTFDTAGAKEGFYKFMGTEITYMFEVPTVRQDLTQLQVDLLKFIGEAKPVVMTFSANHFWFLHTR